MPSFQSLAISLANLLPVDKRREFCKATMAVAYGFPLQACVTRVAELLKEFPLTLFIINNHAKEFGGKYSVEKGTIHFVNNEGEKKSLTTLQLEHAKYLRHLNRLRYAHEWKTIDMEIEDSGEEDEDRDDEDEEEETDLDSEDDTDDDDIPRLGAEDSSEEEEEEEELEGEEIVPVLPIALH